MKKALLVLTLGAVALIGLGAAGQAGEARARKKPVAVATVETGEQPKSAYYHRARCAFTAMSAGAGSAATPIAPRT